MTALWIILAVYFVGFLVFARACEFHDEKPGDKLIAGLVWPLILIFLLWNLWTKKATYRFTIGKKVYTNTKEG